MLPVKLYGVSITPNRSGIHRQMKTHPDSERSSFHCVTSANPAIATVPASVAFAAGQTSVALPVSGLASGSTTIRVSANGGQAAATVNVNAPPTVSMTAPANNAVFAAGASIALNATAADADGTV